METSVRQAMRAVKNTVMQFSEIEVKIREATSNDPWGPSSTILSEISRATNNYEDYPKLFHQLWKRLNDTEHVMHVQKALIVVEYLLRNGAERFINDCKRRARDIAQLKKYKHYDTNNQDDAKECRARAKAVYDLLMDDAKIADERGKAARIRDVRLQGFGGGPSELHVSSTNEMTSPNDRRYTNDDDRNNFDDRREYRPPKVPEHDGEGESSAPAHGEKKKKKKKKEKKEEGEEEKEHEGEEEKNGKDEEKKEKKVKKPKKKKGKEHENGSGDFDSARPAGASFGASSATFGQDPFPASKAAASSSSSVASDPFASSSSASSAYAAIAAGAAPASSASSASSDDIFNQLARPDVPVNHGGEVDLMTGFGAANPNGEDLTHVFSSSLALGDNSSSSSHQPKPKSPVLQSDQAAEVFGRKRSDLWESDLLNVDNIKDTETKKKSVQPKEQQMTLGMMRSIQPLGSAPPKINNADRRSGIVPAAPSGMFPAATPAAAPIGMMTPMGVAAPMGMQVAMAPVGMAYGMGMAMAPMGAMGMAPMGIAAAPMMAPMSGMGGMAMAGHGGMPVGSAPLGFGGTITPRSVAGPNSATNDIFFR